MFSYNASQNMNCIISFDLAMPLQVIPLSQTFGGNLLPNENITIHFLFLAIL